MKKLLLLLLFFVPLMMEAQSGQFNYDYSIIYFDQWDVPEGMTPNDGYRLATLAIPGVKFLQRNDDIRRDDVRIEITTSGGTKTRYKMTDDYIDTIENDITEAPRNASAGDPEWLQSPTVRNYGPFQFEFLRQDLQRRGDGGRYRLYIRKLPRTYRLRFQRSSNGGDTWTNYTGALGGILNNIPTSGYDITNRTHSARWNILRMRVLVLDENGREVQRTRDLAWE